MENTTISDELSHYLENELDSVIDSIIEEHYIKDDVIEKLKNVRDSIPCSCGRDK